MSRLRYAVKEVFVTLQGEGARAGTKAVFLRFAGCNLWSGRPEDRAKGRGACARWCDTDFHRGSPMTADEILERLNKLWPGAADERWVVVTGGEPMLQLDAPLVDVLHRAGWRVAVETNGSLDPKPDGARVLGMVDWVTVSPKLGAPLELGQADEVKVVLPGAVPGESGWTDAALLALEDRVAAGHYFVQPQDVVFDGGVGDTLLHPAEQHAQGVVRDAEMALAERVAVCCKFVSEHPRWRLGLQLHKYARLP